ncbi:MAG: hypothetical protein JWP87_4812 [Labilithrix sp.]|nr:hypothetical protein [Labilithrix sp.]
MSPARRNLAGFAFATALLVGRSARAEEPVTESARSHPWTLSVRGGYGTVFTAGVSYLCMGLGASVARSFGDRRRDATGGIEDVASGEDNPTALAIDDRAIFWTTPKGIRSRAK